MVKTVESVGNCLGDVIPEMDRVMEDCTKLPETLSVLEACEQLPVNATDVQESVATVKLEAKLTSAYPVI